ncbi:hypothetical protein GCM10022226_42190 [Sphaerisporangium flaviroseum]|uniref:Peptidase M11 gametolysin domain-containing protein n=1 Tax=Sphaerisporangium flaviroseum TaxID=509199 RepID=A0ABP7IFL7_9ACTN
MPNLDGLYEGDNGDLAIVLRVDANGSAVISGDVFRRQPDGRNAYIASLRTAPGSPVTTGAGQWPVAWQSVPGTRTTGSLAIGEGAEGALPVVLRLDEPLGGLPFRTDLAATLTRKGDALRLLGLEIEVEQGVTPPNPVTFQGENVDFGGCLAAAGFAVGAVGTTSSIPAGLASSWDDSMLYSVLSDIMLIKGDASLRAVTWELHLLLLSRAAEPRLLGVMFDAEGLLQRQGAAVFAGAIPNKANRDRKLVQTIVHELGHALNLAHRFERAVGRADSTSFMNYDWKYRGGGQEEAYWEGFDFTFDADELEFLRHGPQLQVVPGGAAFHSVRYWADGTGGHVSSVPEIASDAFRLTLTAPAGGPLFRFGQPVFLTVTLENRGTAEVEVEREFLDPKAGVLEILVRRRTGTRAETETEAVPFTPIAQRCLADLQEGEALALAPGASISNNLNLTFGSGGFTFAEPGDYDVIPVLGIYGRTPLGDVVQWVVQGEPLRIRVAHPQSLAEEGDATVLRRPDVGAWFALGGAAALEGARDALAEVRERRQAKEGLLDPVVAAIVRAEGIAANRTSVRLGDKGFTRYEGDPEVAAQLLGSLDERALRAFDPHTARQTTLLADRLKALS